MSNYLDEWKAICAIIDGLESNLNNFLKIAEIHTMEKTDKKDQFNIFRSFIVSEFDDIIARIQDWKNRYCSLPLEVKNIISYYINFKHGEKRIIDIPRMYASQENSGGMSSHSSLISCQSVLPLFALKAKINYFLNDSEFKIKSLTELAFEHLKRTIEVNSDVKEKWDSIWRDTAIIQKEVAFEKLGALHLLSHGIWAFKINGEKERTDLIYQEPLNNYRDNINRSALGLVLTEWKRVDSVSKNLEEKAKQAIHQLKQYECKVLSGIELKQTRYVVLITQEELETPLNDFIENNICYRYIIISTNNNIPSKRIKKITGQKKVASFLK